MFLRVTEMAVIHTVSQFLCISGLYYNIVHVNQYITSYVINLYWKQDCLKKAIILDIETKSFIKIIWVASEEKNVWHWSI